MDEHNDGKTLIGSYVCSEQPGEFRWQPGPLTQAIKAGFWVVFENIDQAASDVQSILLPLLEGNNSFMTGYGEAIRVAGSFRLFSTISTSKVYAVQGSTSLVSAQARKNFVLYAGGLVWALDWCPRAEQGKDSGTNYQFLVVAAHPPDSTYHKLGAPLKGRGMVQIWCILNYTINEDTQIPVGSTKKKYKKTTVGKKVDDKSVRPRGRPRKNPVNKIPDAEPEKSIIFHNINVES
ncbi:hypothetical protein RND81_13G050800 [Saponaria officinalis]|uniref:ATPase dynein-related AAA domain-containing protein n=1 Tax=Saponaria officinalis TaxID=3572 RepID=A0AAW1H482_SAPOF